MDLGNSSDTDAEPNVKKTGRILLDPETGGVNPVVRKRSKTIDGKNSLRKYIRSPMLDDSDSDDNEHEHGHEHDLDHPLGRGRGGTGAGRYPTSHRRFKSHAPLSTPRSGMGSPIFDDRIVASADNSPVFEHLDDISSVFSSADAASLPPSVVITKPDGGGLSSSKVLQNRKQFTKTKLDQSVSASDFISEGDDGEDEDTCDESVDNEADMSSAQSETGMSPGMKRLKTFKFPADNNKLNNQKTKKDNGPHRDEKSVRIKSVAHSTKKDDSVHVQPPSFEMDYHRPGNINNWAQNVAANKTGGGSIAPSISGYQSMYVSSESEDDTLSVIEEAMNEEDKKSTQPYELDNSSNVRFILKWFWKVMKYLLLIAFFMAPSLVCEVYKKEDWKFCYIYGTPILRFSIWFSIASFGIFFSHLVVMIIMVIIKKTPYLGVQFLYYITNLNKPLKWAMVTLIVYIAWGYVFRGTTVLDEQSFGEKISSVFACFFITAFAFLAKAVLIRFLAIRFQRAAYYKRVKSALFAEYILMTLLECNKSLSKDPLLSNTMKTVKRYMKKNRGNNSQDAEKGQQDPVKSGDDKENNNNNDDTASKMSWFTDAEKEEHETNFVFETVPVTEEELIDKKKISNHKLAVFIEFLKMSPMDFTKSIFKSIIFRVHGQKNCLRPEDVKRSETGELHLKLTQSHAARIIAGYIFKKIKKSSSREIYPEDFGYFVPPSVQYQGFSMFDGNWDGSLTEREIYSTMLSISRERKALRTALVDAESIIDRLDTAITFMLWVALVVVYCMIATQAPEKVLQVFSQFLLACAFAISNSVKAVIESIIFIYIRHPFDIGDRVVINKVIHVITRISLLTTETRRYDNAVIYYNNAELSSTPILNLRRSPDQFDLIEIQCAFDTPTYALRTMEARIAEYLKKRTSNYYPKFEMEYKEIENVNRLKMCLRVQYRGNFQNIRRYRERRGKLILRIKKICDELDINYDLPQQRVVHEGDHHFWDPTPEDAPGTGDGGMPSNVHFGTLPSSMHQQHGQYDSSGGSNASNSYRGNAPPPPHQHSQRRSTIPLKRAPAGYNTLNSYMADGVGGYGMQSALNQTDKPVNTGEPPSMPTIPEDIRYQDGWFTKPSPYEAHMRPIENDPYQAYEEKVEEEANAEQKAQEGRRTKYD